MTKIIMKHTKHSQERMNGRGITQAEIECVLDFCDDDHRGRYVCNRKACQMIESELDAVIRELESFLGVGRKMH